MGKLDCILVYHWQAWDGFLISHLVADHCHLPAQYDDDPAQLERWLTPHIRAVLPQINLTDSGVFPARRAALLAHLQARGIRVLNAAVSHIGKRRLHALLEQAGLPSARATRHGPGAERLFVKTDLNWGGASERRLPPDLQQQLLPTWVQASAQAIAGWDGYYTVLREAVPPALWHDPRVVIERYIENPQHSFYRVYGFGEALVVVKAHSHALIKKLAGDTRDSNYLLQRQQLLQEESDLPPALMRVLKGFVLHCPLAYFCLDIVHDEHDYTIIDLNLTPWAGRQPQTSEAVEFLCQGAISHLQQDPLRSAA